MTTLTVANAVVTMTVAGVFTTPQTLQQFSADDIYGFGRQRVAETAMGADGYLTGGVVFVPVQQTVVLQADSPSIPFFDLWFAKEQQLREKLVANGSAALKGVATRWTMTRGFLTEYPPTPAAAKILGPRAFSIVWQRISPATLAR